jgi:surfactin synthase thioesterase subunit
MERTAVAGWIRRFHPATAARIRLVCFPHAGGSASFYHPASAALAPAVEVLAVQYPGRQDRWDQPFAATIEEMAERVTAALLPWAGEPLALFGHSMGAAVAFEVAIRLQALGTPARRLYASGRRAPSIAGDSAVHRLGDRELVEAIRVLDGTTPDLLADEELVRLVLPAVRADYRAIETYRSAPGRAVDCPITALAGTDDHRVPLAHVHRWRRHTTGDFEVREFPGGHFYLVSNPEPVLETLRGVGDDH